VDIFGNKSGVRVIARFCHPFGIALTRTTVLIHCHDLCFSGDAIKEFFYVVTDGCSTVVRELLLIL